MKAFHVRDILKLSEDEVWATIPHQSIDDKIKLTFDDGSVHKVSGRATVFSQYFWNFHRAYPATQVLPKHHLLDRYISKSVYLRLFTDSFWQCYFDNESKGVSREALMRLAYTKVSNAIFNMIVSRLSPWVTSISNTDILEMVKHPKIAKALASVDANHKNPKVTIDETYAIIEDVLTNDKGVIANPLAYAARAKLVDMRQIKQCIGPRGYPTDVDDHIFHKTPILPSFYSGLVELTDALTESRSASKAHFYQKGPMEKSEYLNRSTQLLCMSLKRLHMTDCGSRGTISRMITKENLDNHVGKRVVLEDGTQVWGTPEVLKGLIGKVVKMRSIIHCVHPDEAGVCLHCFGAIGFSVPHNTNLGYVSCAIILGDTGQNLLSAKHLVASAAESDFEFTKDMVEFISRHEQTGTLALNKALKKQQVNLIIPKENGEGLNDVLYVDNVNVLQKGLVTKFTNLVFEKHTRHTVEYRDIGLNLGSTPAHLTHEALDYVKHKGFSINNNDDFVIDLSSWDYSKPFIEIPLKQYNTVDFMLAVDRAITGNTPGNAKAVKMTRGSRIIDYSSPEEAVNFFFELINSKLNCNLAHVETIVYCLMCADPDRGDYSLPRKGAPNKLMPYNVVMRSRSLAPFMAFERQFKTLVNPHTYMFGTRQAHPMDDIFVPAPERTMYLNPAVR